MTEELKNNDTVKYRMTRWCRSAVCGSDGFIPNSEFEGDNCELTCDINQD